MQKDSGQISIDYNDCSTSITVPCGDEAALASEVPVRKLVLRHGRARRLHRHVLTRQVLVAKEQLVFTLHNVHKALIGVVELAQRGELLVLGDQAGRHVALLLEGGLHNGAHTAEHRKHRSDLAVPCGERRDLRAVHVDRFGGAVLALHAWALEHVVVPAQAHGEVLHHQSVTTVWGNDVTTLDRLETDVGNTRGGNVRGNVFGAVGHVIDGGEHTRKAGGIGVERAHHLGRAEYTLHQGQVGREVRHQQGLPLLVGAEPEALLDSNSASSVDATVLRHNVVHLLEQGSLLDPEVVALLLALPVGEEVEQLGHGLTLVRVVEVTGLLLVVGRGRGSEGIDDGHHRRGLSVPAVEDGLGVGALAVNECAVASGQRGDLGGLRLDGLEGVGSSIQSPKPLTVVQAGHFVGPVRQGREGTIGIESNPRGEASKTRVSGIKLFITSNLQCQNLQRSIKSACEF
mmetsp:Transcript_33440/g.57293  ORF Transcript_33440/g.57293 Transcript_33440/m.57293 type:complete len:459 (+) Transcript_33440:96-1472(+)